MDQFIHLLWVVTGLVLLYFGAEGLVKGAADIALKLGISPLVVGLTVVAFGTSAPELLVCLDANKAGEPSIALGNIIGSNICNIALILGVGALIRPIVVDKQIILREMPILLVATLAFVVMMLTGDGISRVEGGILTLGIIVYVVSSFLSSKKENSEESDDFSAEDIKSAREAGAGKMVLSVLFILLGLAGLKYGAQVLVEHGEILASEKYWNISPAIVALLLFAFGTSLPELATSIVASRKGQGDIITGNAVGSCIFNIMAVMGITALVHSIAYRSEELENFDLYVMVGVCIAILPFMWSKKKLSRAEGGVLLLAYLAYCILRITVFKS